MLVGVDLLPVVAGGANGGAKLLAVSLLNAISGPNFDLTCFCRKGAFAELRTLLKEEIVLVQIPELIAVHVFVTHWQIKAQKTFDVAFFPFTRVSFHSPHSSVVSVIHDLQFLDLPHNFTHVERIERADAFRSCVNRADLIVTVSKFVRSSVSSHSAFPADRIVTIYNAIGDRLTKKVESGDFLAKRELNTKGYFIYPANFWEHKNHRSLLAGYLLYARQTGQGALPLVLTGAGSGKIFRDVQQIASKFGSNKIRLLGFVPEEELQVLIRNAASLVFPSLYEGFGIPLLEALILGTPIACGFDTCIPEIVGGAAHFFDSRKPRQISAALKRLVVDDTLRASLEHAAVQQAKSFGTTVEMARMYGDTFRRAVAMPRTYRDAADDLYSDGWIGNEAVFSVGPRSSTSKLSLNLSAPPHGMGEDFSITVESSATTEETILHGLRPGNSYTLTEIFPPEGGYIKVKASFTFTPAAVHGTADTRMLSLLCSSANVEAAGTTTSLLRPQPSAVRYGSKDWFRPIVLARNVVKDGIAISFCVPAGGIEKPLIAVIDITPTPDSAAVVALANNGARKRRLKVNQNGRRIEICVGKLGHREVVEVTLKGAKEFCVEEPQLISSGAPIPSTLLMSKSFGLPTKLARTPEVTRGFSIVMPSFNQGGYIERSIKSCLIQEGISDFHIFDGGSNDETSSICEQYADRLLYVREKDRGQAHAVNKGIKASSGDIIAWLNSDDTYRPGAFAAVRKVFDENPQIGIVYGEAFHIDEYDAVIDRYPSDEFNFGKLIDTCFICQPATFVRRAVFEDVGMLREDLHYAMDYEMWLRAASSGVAFMQMTDVLANSRLYGTNKTLGARVQVHQEINDMLTGCLGIASRKWISAFSHFILQELDEGQTERDREIGFETLQRMGSRFWRL